MTTNDSPGPPVRARAPRPAQDPLERLRQRLADIPCPTPREIFERLEQLGYVGQDASRRALALLAHRHVRRLRYIYLDACPREDLPPKENHLLLGPTGCGKTFLVELLFRDILELPTALVDITAFSETGYVGQDVSSLLTRLLYSADGDVPFAQVGVVCIDEFDKIASGQNNAVFSGAGTTKDVSGLGVQRELLKLLERSQVPVSTAFDHSTYQQHVMMRTDDVLFVAVGAFSGLKALAKRRKGGIGFGAESPGAAAAADAIAVGLEQDELEDAAIFQAYGFLPELIGRFARIVPFAPLDAATLKRILVEQVVPERDREMRLAGKALRVEPGVYDRIVDEALRRQTGARGLASSLLRRLEDAAFEAYSEPEAREVRLELVDDEIRARVV